MKTEEFVRYDAVGLAELVRAREVKPRELLECAIAICDEHNPELNAVVTRFDELAVAMADDASIEAPLSGVPFLLKDAFAELAGTPLTNGSRQREGVISAQDTTLVARYKAAGLVPFGKTNTPEWGLVAVTEPLLHGATHNPWALDRTPGGSSGGTAAAVAAGIVPMAHGNDGGGSIRIPASCCGLVGLKPTRGRNPLGPTLGEAIGGLGAEHVLTRSVRDSAAALDATHGPEVGDPYCAPPVTGRFMDALNEEPRGLRIAMRTTRGDGRPLHAECARAVRETAALCESLGHHVEEANLPLPMPLFLDAFLKCWYLAAAVAVDGTAKRLGKPLGDDDLEPLTRAMVERGRALGAVEHEMARVTLHVLSRFVGRFYLDHDLYLDATLGTLPIAQGTIDVCSTDLDAQFQAMLGDFLNDTPIANATGQPAISLPLHHSPDGLPIGVQFTAAFGEEKRLLALAAQLERAAPWRDRHPPRFG